MPQANDTGRPPDTGCPPPDRLLAYSLGKLPEAGLEMVATHLETCPTCLDALSTVTDENDSLLTGLRTSVCEDSYLDAPEYQEALAKFEAVGFASSVRSADSTPRSVPEQLGRYRILKELGRGGMGTVYLAEDTPLGRQVAIKIPHFQPQDSPLLLEQFYREARAAAAIEHPNLCPIYDVGQIDDIHYPTFLTNPKCAGFWAPFGYGSSMARRLRTDSARMRANMGSWRGVERMGALRLGRGDGRCARFTFGCRSSRGRKREIGRRVASAT